MKNPPDTQAPIERRGGIERRQADLRPPGGIEHRRGIDPRKPEVQEVDLTASDWAQFEAGNPLAPKLPGA